MFCRKCGAVLSEGARFCPKCGTESSTHAATATGEQAAFASNPRPASSDGATAAPPATAAPLTASPTGAATVPPVNPPTPPGATPSTPRTPRFLGVAAVGLLLAAAIWWVFSLATGLAETAVPTFNAGLSGWSQAAATAIFCAVGLLPAATAAISALQSIRVLRRGVGRPLPLCVANLVLCIALLLACIAFRGLSIGGLALAATAISEAYLVASVVGVGLALAAMVCLIALAQAQAGKQGRKRLVVALVVVALVVVAAVVGGFLAHGAISGALSSQAQPTSGDQTSQSYYEDSSEIVSQVPADESADTLTGEEAFEELESRGFSDLAVTADYDMEGDFLDGQEVSAGSSTAYPIYQAYYTSEAGDVWVILVYNGQVMANPLSYNASSTSDVMLVLSESETVTSYDGDLNMFYETVPDPSELDVRVVERIDASTLDSLTSEEVAAL